MCILFVTFTQFCLSRSLRVSSFIWSLSGAPSLAFHPQVINTCPMNPGHLGSCGFCLPFSLPLCLYHSLSLSLPLLLSLVCFVFFLSIPVSFFPPLYSRSVFFLLLLKNDFAHLDRALNGRYTISCLVELIKNRLEYWVRISQDFFSGPLLVFLPHILNIIG